MRYDATACTRWLLVGLSAVACRGEGEQAARGAWEALRDTVADTVVVRTVSGSLWRADAFLEPDLSIGELEGSEEYMIGSVRSIAVGADGVIFVLDEQIPLIRVYAADGTFLRNVGRKGGGPGEYERPGAIATLPDGRLIVRDVGNNRLSVYSPTGDYLHQQWFPGGFNTSRRLYVDTAGVALSLVLLNYGTAPWEWEYGLVRLHPDEGILDTVAAPTWEYERARITASREGSSSSSNVPFSPGTAWTFSPLGYFIGGLSTDYRVDLYRTREPVLRIERAWDPVPVLPEEAAERRRRAEESMRRQYPGWRWNGPPVPETKPPFRDVTVSDEGNVWVQLSRRGRPIMTEAEAREEEQRSGRPQLRYAEPVAFDVFTPNGEYLGQVRTPESFTTSPEPIIRGDTIWAVARDELDVPKVVRYRVVRIPR